MEQEKIEQLAKTLEIDLQALDQIELRGRGNVYRLMLVASDLEKTIQTLKEGMPSDPTEES